MLDFHGKKSASLNLNDNELEERMASLFIEDLKL